MMVNLKQKESDSEDSSINNASTSTMEGKEPKRTCKDCQTTKTPLWRGGPAGPRSLCNACGIRYRKSRRALLGVSTTDGADKFKRKRSISKGNNKIDNLELPLKMQWMELGREIFSQRSARIEKHMRSFGEEEQAAFLLMALSCGSAYA